MTSKEALREIIKKAVDDLVNQAYAFPGSIEETVDRWMSVAAFTQEALYLIAWQGNTLIGEKPSDPPAATEGD